MPVFYDLHEVILLLSLQRLRAKIIDDKQVHLGYFGNQLDNGSIHPCQPELAQKFLHIEIVDLVSLITGFVSQRCSQIASRA